MTPVIMFHSVGLERSGWSTNFLSVPYTHMEAFIRFLSENKYDTPFLDGWYHLQDHPYEIKTKQVFLTFDDGYLDNWVYLFPLLEKYGIRATIFVNPEFIDPSLVVRLNMVDVWRGRVKREELHPMGFLNWPEICAMQASGLVDIQSHSMSHNWYFINERIIDFYSPQIKNLPWLAWLAKPERKPFWMVEDQRGFVRPRSPIFENGRSLGIRRYFPDQTLIDFIVDRFANSSQLKKEAAHRDCLEFIAGKGSSGLMETDEEMVTRYRYELKSSKVILEKKLNKKVNFLCWPGGAYNDLSVLISRQVGYLASTLASRERYLPFDNTGPYKRIARHGLGSSFSARGKAFINNNPKTLTRSFLELQGKWYWKYPRRIKKIYYMIFK
jgi:peptidoglycan/xylan/chitin deacetylase (PgdA/CDA1 family)